jgi:hypothetical protein
MPCQVAGIERGRRIVLDAEPDRSRDFLPAISATRPTQSRFPPRRLTLRHCRRARPALFTGASIRLARGSEIAVHRVIFSDGIEGELLEFNAGSKAGIELSERVGLLVT